MSSLSDTGTTEKTRERLTSLYLFKVHFDDEESNYEANMKKFDRRISQADVLLQILIEQIQMMQDIISGLQEDAAVKTEVEKISKNYTVRPEI